MALPLSFFSQTIADNTVKNNGQPETSTWSVAVTTLTAANLVAQAALISALDTAISAILLGLTQKDEVVLSRNVLTSGPAASNLAQRENKYLVRYHGATLNKKFNVSLPTADLSLLPNHSEFLDITAGVGLAVKSAWELVVKSPDDGAEATILDSIQFVGRNT